MSRPSCFVAKSRGLASHGRRLCGCEFVHVGRAAADHPSAVSPSRPGAEHHTAAHTTRNEERRHTPSTVSSPSMLSVCARTAASVPSVRSVAVAALGSSVQRLHQCRRHLHARTQWNTATPAADAPAAASSASKPAKTPKAPKASKKSAAVTAAAAPAPEPITREAYIDLRRQEIKEVGGRLVQRTYACTTRVCVVCGALVSSFLSALCLSLRSGRSLPPRH